MKDWLIRQRYGFGAARVRLAPEPYRGNGAVWTLREGMLRAGGAFELAGPRSVVLAGFALLFGLAVVFAPAIALLPLRFDAVELEMIGFETAKLEPAPLPVPVPAAPAAPKPRATPKPAPKPPPPPAAPKPEVAPKPPLPVPQAPPPARTTAPKPAPPPRALPKPAPAPIAVAVAPPAPPLRSARAPRTTAPPPRLRVDPLAVPAAPEAEFTPVSTRRANARSARIAAPQTLARIDAVAPPANRPVADRPAAVRSGRRGATAPPLPDPRRSARASALRLPGLADTPAPSPVPYPASAKRPARADVARNANDPGKPSSQNAPELAGVPLASLASCVSDREEDRLKQRVLATVDDRAECVSAAGRYVFVETRNLNAFLMYVQRNVDRRQVDRCAELSLALDCLTQRGTRRSGRI